MSESAGYKNQAERKEGAVHQRLGRLLESLRDAHELDHAILEDLGIKHPHVPILSVIEMLGHLRDKHVEDRQIQSSIG